VADEDRYRGGASSRRGIAAVIAEMDAIEVSLVAAQSRLRFFHSTYNRTTHAVGDEVARGGFADNAWAERWDVAFADLYLEALRSWQAGQSTPTPWLVAFDASRSRLAPLRHVLLGMNAHINYDLPQALLAVISDGDFDDPELLARRASDHRHIDTILAARVAAEEGILAADELPRDRTWVDSVIAPLNRFGTKRFLRESRTKVWRNTRTLARARRAGSEEYIARLAELEELAAAKVATLLEPGHVLLKLARSGFGVELPQ
jgi:hypothetical protein